MSNCGVKQTLEVRYPDSETPKLSYYAGTFETAEIDSTFYANPTKGLVFGWLKNTPKEFQFSAKLPQTITHKKQLDLAQGIEVDLKNFLDLMKPLHDSNKLGPLLIQLPPSFDFTKIDRLEQFFEILPKDYSFAIEFRNKSWFQESKEDDLYALLVFRGYDGGRRRKPSLVGPVLWCVASRKAELRR